MAGVRMDKRIVKILLLVSLAGAIVALRLSPLGSLLTFDNLKQHRESLVLLVQGHYWLSVISFVAIYVLAVALSIPGAVILTLAGGFLFGAPATTLYVNIAATAGATIAFLSARYLLGDSVQRKYQAQLFRFNQEIERNGTNYLLTLRLIPLFPFFLINFLSGLTQVPLRVFLWTTMVGIIPGTAVYAFAGQQLGSINSLSEVLSGKIFTAFVVLALFTTAPIIGKYIQRKSPTT